MKILYNIYLICIALPIFLIATIITALTTSIGCLIGPGSFFGFYPGSWWSWLTCRLLLLPVHVEGRENIEHDKSYVFVANHQGAIDIFLLFGFIRHPFRWMMKKAIRKIPFVGHACWRAGHIFVDKESPAAVENTLNSARKILQGGISLMVFPEGTRSATGKIGRFRKGGFVLAQQLSLPIVPITINGPFDILPKGQGLTLPHWHPLTMKIHEPIYPKSQDPRDLVTLCTQAHDIIQQALPKKYR